jgi:Cu-Zn family superoxide dismutase
MNKLIAAVMLAVWVPFLSPGDADQNASDTQRAIAVVHPASNSKVRGTIYFTQKSGYVEISGEVTGLSPGLHGFHIHEYGDCSAMDASSAGGHFNPTHMPHAGPDNAKRHVGDLGNLKADESGKAVVRTTDKMIQLHGPHSILGRSVIVHASTDDLKSQPSGNSGDRVACGVIGIANPEHPSEAKVSSGS